MGIEQVEQCVSGRVNVRPEDHVASHGMLYGVGGCFRAASNGIHMKSAIRNAVLKIHSHDKSMAIQLFNSGSLKSR